MGEHGVTFKPGNFNETNVPSLEVEATEEHLEPTPLDVLIPGIDLEKIKRAEAEAKRRTRTGERTGAALENSFFGMGLNIMIRRPEQIENVKKYLAGQIIVDLGAGDDGQGREIAKAVAARSYVAVEPNFYEQLTDSLSDTYVEKMMRRDIKAKGSFTGDRDFDEKKLAIYEKRIPYGIAAVDMLSFLQALPDNSVSVLLGGIDNAIMSAMTNEYFDKVQTEIKRVLHQDGAVFLVHSNDNLASNLENKTAQVGFTDYGRNSGLKLYTKPKAELEE